MHRGETGNPVLGRPASEVQAWLRSIWSGSISFGLVTIPVKTYSRAAKQPSRRAS